jgi:SAM-dependent methyltransferase
MKKFLKSIAKAFSPLKPMLQFLSQFECAIAKFWVENAHMRLMLIQWGIPPQPESFDHNIDLFYYWRSTRNPQWVERGVFGGLSLRGGDVLELACGDGFNSRNFYSLLSRSVTACDFDQTAIGTAKRKNSAPNVKYVMADIRTDMPEGKYDNVIWDASIEHFTPSEISSLMSSIKTRLTPGGVLSGHTIVVKKDGTKSLSHHEYEFKDKHDLMRFLSPYFKNVTVFETEYPVRHNLYFWASDGVLPFAHGWDKYIAFKQE